MEMCIMKQLCMNFLFFASKVHFHEHLKVYSYQKQFYEKKLLRVLKRILVNDYPLLVLFDYLLIDNWNRSRRQNISKKEGELHLLPSIYAFIKRILILGIADYLHVGIPVSFFSTLPISFSPFFPPSLFPSYHSFPTTFCLHSTNIFWVSFVLVFHTIFQVQSVIFLLEVCRLVSTQLTTISNNIFLKIPCKKIHTVRILGIIAALLCFLKAPIFYLECIPLSSP